MQYKYYSQFFFYSKKPHTTHNKMEKDFIPHNKKKYEAHRNNLSKKYMKLK